MSEYYNHTTVPATGANLSSATMRAEFAAIEAGFAKLPELSTTANRLWYTNSGGTGVGSSANLTFNGTTLAVVAALAVTGAMTLTGALNVTGNTTLGDATTDTHTVNGDTTLYAGSTATSGLKFVGRASDDGATIEFYNNANAARVGRIRALNTGLTLSGQAAGTANLSIDTSGNITTSGNTTLGDATTDTVTVSGYMGVGGAGNSGRAINIVSTALTGTAQYGIFSTPTNSAAGSSQLTTIYSSPIAANTVTTVRHFYADNATGAGSVTTQVGLDVLDLTKGTTNIGAQLAVSSGANKWNIYASGSANNAFAGNVRIGSTTAPTNALDVTGNATVSGQTGLGGAAIVNYTEHRVSNTFTSGGASTVAIGFGIEGTITSAAGDTTYVTHLQVLPSGTITNGTGEVHSLITTARFTEPVITLTGADTVTNAATVYIVGAPTEGTNNYALAVASGTSVFAGQTSIGTVTVQDYIKHRISNTITSGGASANAFGTYIDGTVTAATGDTNILSQFSVVPTGIVTPGVTQNAALITTAYFTEPIITLGSGDTATLAATVYIGSAPTEGSVNYALVANGGTLLGASSVGANHTKHYIDNTFTSGGASTVAYGTRITGTVTAAAGDTARHVSFLVNPTSMVTQGATEAITLVTSAYFTEPAITVGTGDTITTAATVYIENAPTEGATNAALYVASGATRLFSGSSGNGVNTFFTDSASAGLVYFLNNSNTGMRSVQYGSAYASGTVFGVGASGVSIYSDAAAPFGIGTYGVAQPLLFGTNSSERGRFSDAGRFLLGGTSDRLIWTVTPRMQIEGVSSTANSSMALTAWAGAFASIYPALIFGRSRGTTAGDYAASSSGDYLGSISFTAGDGTDMASDAAYILVRADAAHASNDTPGRIEFYTTAVGASTGTERLRINSTGQVLIGDTSNANSTIGLTINQGASDNEILSLKSSDVAHGITSVTETDTFAVAQKLDATNGGVVLIGYSASTMGVRLTGTHTTEDTTKTTSSSAHVGIRGNLKSGTTTTTPGANANLLVVQSSTTTRFILDADGDSHQDVGTSWTNFHGHDDHHMLSLLSAHVSRKDDPIRERFFGDFLKERRDVLERVGLATFNDDGHHFVNMSKLAMLNTGAILQAGDRIKQLETVVEKMRQLLPPQAQERLLGA